MNARIAATALCLVNWKGVFFERYELDRGVTALEGANGAGKTTVMIAAYVALMPDLGRLRFTNVGESGGAQDRGLWGRLGATGRPSYVTLALEIPGSAAPCVLGVKLERRAEPALELTPFLIRDLPEAAVAEVLLRRDESSEYIQELAEIRAAVQAAGGRLETFHSVKEYFARLFELGISPLRLTQEDARSKFNELLRTSMSGGISRALSHELRNFLLRHESGLTDTVTFMRRNVEECARTRQDVDAARELQAELARIAEAELAYFEATAAQAAAGAAESANDLRSARTLREQAHATLHALEQSVQHAAESRSRAEQSAGLAATRTQTALTAKTAAAGVLALAGKQRELTKEVKARREQQELSQVDLRAAQARLGFARREQEAARERYDTVARGIADSEARDEARSAQARARKRAQTRLRELEALRAELARPEIAEPLEWTSPAARARFGEHLQAREADALSAYEHASLRAARRTHQQLARAKLQALVARVETRTELAELGLNASEAEATSAPDLQTRARQLLSLRERAVHAAEQVQHAEGEYARLQEAVPALRTLKAALESVGAQVHTRNEFYGAITNQREVHAAAQHSAHQAELAVAAARAGFQQAEQLLSLAQKRTRKSTERDLLAAQLHAGLGRTPPAGSGGLGALLGELSTERATESRRAQDLSALREGIAAQLAELSGARENAALSHARAIGAEPASRRFEALDIAAAARMEAQLGPRADTWLLPTGEAATQWLKQLPDYAQDVFVATPAQFDALLGTAEAAPDPLSAAPETAAPAARERPEPEVIQVDGTDYLLVRDSYGIRRTRLRKLPQLGLLSTAAKVRELRARDSACTAELEALRSREVRRAAHEIQLQRLLVLELELDSAAAEAPSMLSETPEPHVWLAACTRAEHEQAQAIAAAEQSARALRQWQACEPHAYLLDSADPEQRLEHLRATLGTRRNLCRWAEREQHSLSELHAGFKLLALELDASEDHAELRESELPPALHAACMAIRRGRDALLELEELAFALAAGGEETASSGSSAAATPERELHAAELQNARESVVQADILARDAEAACFALTQVFHDVSAAATLADAELARTSSELRRAGGSADEDAALSDFEQACSELESAKASQLQAADEQAEATREEAKLSERHRNAAANFAQHAESRDARELAAQQAADLWTTLVSGAPALGRALPKSFELAADSARASVDLRAKRRSALTLLLERVRTAHGGELLHAQWKAKPDSEEPEHAIDLCRSIHAWLAERMPTAGRMPAPAAASATTSIVPAPEANMQPAVSALQLTPAAILLGLSSQLAVLHTRLAQQEKDLRFASEDVARTIDLQLRAALAQVRRLNTRLMQVGFGNVAQVRVELRRIDRMDELLKALREGKTQELLFQRDLPIEEALAELFRRHSGGKLGGLRLLDYREYVELVVEVQRRGSSTFEVASPAKLSTGESIGVGAALMMVILSEWEHDARLLRAPAAAGSLRFLFLDEANRLSKDNLGVLFELCQTLELQLLIAAPEVAQAHGNTTYRLVRRVDDQGHEEVLVSGRRLRADSAASADATHAGAAEARGAGDPLPAEALSMGREGSELEPGADAEAALEE